MELLNIYGSKCMNVGGYEKLLLHGHMLMFKIQKASKCSQ